MSLYEAVIEGLTATVIGMGMVFGVLAILCVILYFFKFLTPNEKPKAVPKVEPKAVVADAPPEDEPSEAYDDSELVAVISAAVAAIIGEGARIASITPVASANAVKSAYKGWTAAAIKENHRGLY